MAPASDSENCLVVTNEEDLVGGEEPPGEGEGGNMPAAGGKTGERSPMDGTEGELLLKGWEGG
jgi:hypothetical protein